MYSYLWDETLAKLSSIFRRESGHKLVLESAVVGLVLLAVARLVILAVTTPDIRWVGAYH